MNIFAWFKTRFGPKPNFALMDQTMNHIQAKPETWQQNIWDTRDTACFAGHTARIANENSYNPPVEVPRIAEKALQIDAEQANRLFDPYNTMEDLKKIIAEMKAKYGVRN